MMTQLDANQVIKTVYDEGTGALKVNGIVISGLSGDNDSVSLTDATGTNSLTINTAGEALVMTTPTIVDVTTWLNAVDADIDTTAPAIDVLAFRTVGVMANWVDLDQTDATLQFQGSIDGDVWDDVGAPYTLAAASGHKHFSLIDEPYKFVQLVYTHGTNTNGSLTLKYVMRS